MSGDQPFDPFGGEGGQGGEGEPPKDGEFEGRTYLYIRTNPADTGAEPLAAGLDFWLSPDIWIVKPNGAVGGQAVPNQVNQVQVTVTNAGGIPAIDALVDAFVADPSTAITPATAALVGSGYLDIPAYSTATISFPWTPNPGDTGHRCIVARVSLVAPLDTYLNASVFDVVGDRHVAQRNIQVLEVAQGQSITFPFHFGAKASIESIRVTERTRKLRLDDVVALGGHIAGIPAKRPLAKLDIRPADQRELRELRDAPALVGRDLHARPASRGTGRGLGNARRDADVTEAVVRDRPEHEGRKNFAAVTFQAPREDEAGHLHVIDVREVDERGTVVGGLTFVVRVV